MRYKERKVRLYFRGDAAFASPEIYEYLGDVPISVEIRGAGVAG